MKKIICTILVLMLALAPMCLAESHAPIQMTDKIYGACNLFLSNFTEIGFDSISEYPSDETLVDFAHDHLWFNDNDSFEYGDYFNDNNCRVPDTRIQKIVNDYFYNVPNWVEMSESRYDYRDGYFYHAETGGFMNSGFALTTSITPLGDQQYFVSFLIFGATEDWNNKALSLSLDEAWKKYGAPSDYAHAIVYAQNIADRSTYKLVSYC